MRPVLDFRELNGHVVTYTAHADVCAQKLRDWRKKATTNRCSIFEGPIYRCGYTNPCGCSRLLSLKEKKDCLTRMDLELNVVSSIMRAIVQATPSKDDAINLATSSYIYNISSMKIKLLQPGWDNIWLTLGWRAKNGARVLGLTVRREGNMLTLERGNEVPSVPHIFTWRSVFSSSEKLVGHFPVVKWLRVAAAFIKRREADMTKGLDDNVIDVPLTTMITEVFARVRQEDSVRGKFRLMQVPWTLRGYWGMMELFWRMRAGFERKGIWQSLMLC